MRCTVAVREEGIIKAKRTSIFINIGFSFDFFTSCFGTATLQRCNVYVSFAVIFSYCSFVPYVFLSFVPLLFEGLLALERLFVEGEVVG